jgi:hypothetical protein
MADRDCILRHLAGKAAGHVEMLVSSCKHSIGDVSVDAARNAHMDVRDAIELLQVFNRALRQRIGDCALQHALWPGGGGE